MTVAGNHLCQNGGSCPGAFGANDKVTFYNAIQATVFTSWSDTAIVTEVPTGATTGALTVTSNTYVSNGLTFTVVIRTLTIGATAGAGVTGVDSSDIAQYINTTNCTGPADCAAFTLSLTSGTRSISSIAVTEIGTVDANSDLSNFALFYDTDGDYSNGVVGQYGTTVANFNAGEVATVSGSLVINGTDIYYFYARFDVKNGTAYPYGGKTVGFRIAAATDISDSGSGNPGKTGTPATLAGTTTIRPKLTGYTNSTENALNYSVDCTDCGARIGSGAAYRQTLTIAGYGFGADPGSGSRDTATNKVELVGASTTTLTDNPADTNVTAWSNTSITIRTDTAVTGNSDTDFGTNFGGATALKVTAGGAANSPRLNFYLFPQVTSLTVPTAVTDAAREYDAGDTDGVITLNGTRFGSAEGSGYVRVLGCDASTCSSPTGSVVTNSWSNTAIEARVPTVIANNIYTGSLSMQQGTGANSKQYVYTASGFRVLPRSSNIIPFSAPEGDAVTLYGDHFCQNGGTCPVVFDANNKVIFYNTVPATTFTSWTNTTMQTTVPTGAETGAVALTSATYPSNGVAFTISSLTPDPPTTLEQFMDAGLTTNLATGGTASHAVYLTMIMEAPTSGGTLYAQAEVKPTGTAFACGAGVCGVASESAGVANTADPNLVGYWKFNAGSGSYAADYSGNNNTGTLAGPTHLPSWVAGQKGQALSFDGTEDYVNFSAAPTTATNNWTMMAWIKPSNLSQDGMAISNGYDDGNTGDGYAFGINNGSGTGNGAQLTGFLPHATFIDSGYTFPQADQWYHVVMLRDAGTVKFYVNGSQTGGTSTALVTGAPTEFRIGSQHGVRFFAGSIDGVRIYDRVVSDADIAELYAFGPTIGCSDPNNNCAISALPSDGTKHWQTRVRYNKSGNDYYSDWVSFNTDPDNVNEVDFVIDTSGPSVTAGPSVVPDTNTADVTWSTGLEQSSTQVQYNKTGTFDAACATNNDCTALADTSPRVYDHAVTLSNLDSGTQYYYRVRSVDASGNETVGSTGNFTTLTVNQPAKTTEFFITGFTGSISGLTSATFSVHAPETAVATKSAFIEITGISASTGTNNIEVQMNAQASQTFAVTTNAAGTEFKILYKVTDVNFDPTDNTLYIAPSIETYIVSAKMIITYAYTP